MTKNLLKNYRQFARKSHKKAILKAFFDTFLPEAVYRSTKIEHESVSRKQVNSYLGK